MEGYFVSDLICITYSTQYDEEGRNMGGTYGDSERILNKGKKCFCLNCSETLPFKATRNDG